MEVVCTLSPAKILAVSAISISLRPAVKVAPFSIDEANSCADRVNSDETAAILEDAMRRASELSTAKVSAAEAYESVKQC